MRPVPSHLLFRRCVSALARCASSLAAASLLSCIGDANPGVDPPDDELFFPQGLALDPRASSEAGPACSVEEPCAAGWNCAAGVCREMAPWLFVSNANSDLRFNAGTILAVDLDAFLAVATNRDPGDPSIGAPDDLVSRTNPAAACRRLISDPQTIECTEEPFIEAAATVRTGSFSSDLEAWHRPAAPGGTERTMLLSLVRGDPSVTYVWVNGGRDGASLNLNCDQGDTDGSTCGDAHQLDTVFGDDEELAREPTSIAFADDGSGLAYVVHDYVSDVTLLALDGTNQSDPPRIVDIAPLTPSSVNSVAGGGYGLAVRPCDPENAPATSIGCSRPLVYAGYRHQRQISVFTSVDLDGEAGTTATRDARLVPGSLFFSGGLAPAPNAQLFMGGMAFSRDGEELFMAQTMPAALLRIDTSLDEGNELVHTPSGEVEVCADPSALVVYEDAQQRYGMVTCFRKAALYVVDLEVMSVVAAIRVGSGPHQMVADFAREYIYVANTLDATLSVVDVSRDRATRFTEVARLGLQEPYSS